jgi:molybdopterin-guanine dinucleotide biosynthesis protein A
VKFSNISGVILAGGSGNRLGGITKANIVINGKTIISGIIETITEFFSEIIIVTNAPEEFGDYSRFKIESDQFLNVGPLGGIHAALKASTCEALFVFAGDMPRLDREIIGRQLAYFNSHKCEVLIPSAGSNIEPLHAIYSLSVLKKMEDYLSGKNNYAVRDFLKLVDVNYLPLEDNEKTKSAFTNINRPSDIPFY